MTSSKYQDPTQPADARADDLLSRMTFQEKLRQLVGVWAYDLLEVDRFSETKARNLLDYGIGFITCAGGATTLKPNQVADFANQVQSYLMQNTRMAIPAIFVDECLTGFMCSGATTFPQMIGIASTWLPEYVKQMTGIIRKQMRAVGVRQGLSPVLDIARDPRWGRVEETFGEDPYLAAKMGAAYVRGLQGDDLRTGVLATGKHFLGYAAPEGGKNCAPSRIPPRELMDIYLRPFIAAIEESDLGSVMTAYHEQDGIPCTSSKELFTKLLRETLGFKGLVVSDFYAVDLLRTFHQIVQSKEEAACLAIQAGVDVELPSGDCFKDPLEKAAQEGAIDLSLVDEALRRVLVKKFELGLFESPYVQTESLDLTFDTPDQRDFARQLAGKSIVLLKNEGGLLPLKKDLNEIAVFGPNATVLRNMLGDYSYAGGLEYEDYSENIQVPAELRGADYLTIQVPSILVAIKGNVTAPTRVNYISGVTSPRSTNVEEVLAEAVAVARSADVAIIIAGGKSGQVPNSTSGEFRDLSLLQLPDSQLSLIQAIYSSGTPVVLILVNGRPLAIPWIAENIPAIIEAWVPGEEGGPAIANVLFGDTNPGGKLPISFPRNAGQVPIYYNHHPSSSGSYLYGDYVDCSHTSLFPFGHGLSYTTFELSDLVILPKAVKKEGGIVECQVDVQNTGALEGDEVVQLYVHHTGGRVTRPVMELKGFQRIALQSGEKRTLNFDLPIENLRYYNREMVYDIDPGTIEILIGTSSEDIRLKGNFIVQ